MILAKPRGHNAVIPSRGPCVHVYRRTAQYQMTHIQEYIYSTTSGFHELD